MELIVIGIMVWIFWGMFSSENFEDDSCDNWMKND
jgi:hypothetical protein